MKNKSKWLIPVALVVALFGGNKLLNTNAGQEALRYFQNKIGIVQPVSDGYVPTKGVKVKNDFQYSANDIWYTRGDSLERLAKNSSVESITSKTLADLGVIAKGDEDWRIRELASSMIGSYKVNGDFSDTNPYREMQAEKVRLTIQTATDFGYKASDIWYNRQDALESLVKNPREMSGGLVEDLRLIAMKEDDWRIRELASSMLESYEANKEPSTVKGDEPKK